MSRTPVVAAGGSLPWMWRAAAAATRHGVLVRRMDGQWRAPAVTPRRAVGRRYGDNVSSRGRVDASTPQLNSLSQSVLAHLTAHPAPSSSADTPEEEVWWAADQLLSLLLEPVPGSRHRRNSSSSSATPPSLHPLLAVRVLQRLGYAVCGGGGGGEAAKKGWSLHAHYPSLARRPGSTATAAAAQTPASTATVAVSAVHANTERVTGLVLGPLLPLLGDGTAAQPPHTQVRPVVPVVAEWLCTLPTDASVLPLVRWLPWVVAVYEDAARRRQLSSLPPLLQVLPHLLAKLRGHLSSSNTAGAADVVHDALCERCLASLLTVSCTTTTEAGDGTRRALAEVLWWHGDAPLLCLAGVRRAMQNAGQTVCLAPAASPSQLQELQRAGAGDSAAVAPHVRLRIDDDDVYRRFLLRLAALQSSAPAVYVSGAVPPAAMVTLELAEPLTTASRAAHTTTASDGDADVILRFVQPLHEYLLLLADAGTTADPRVQLTFASVVHVLTAVLRRLEELKQLSRCRGAAGVSAVQRAGAPASPPTDGVFALLPHKSRLHTLKSLCELLLRHARAVQASASTASPCAAWFADVGAPQQETVLRRLCGAARALVRVVMEERRCSLAEEGPEGSVLTASSLAASPTHDSRAVPTTATTMTTTAAAAASFERTLRTLAYRVVEPALSRLSAACAAARTGVPVHVLTFAEWTAFGELAGGRGAVDVGDVHAAVMDAVKDVFHCVGGRAGLQTAAQVLPHPGQQPLSAVVEGVRLTALRCWLFDGLRSSSSSAAHSQSAIATTLATPEEADAYMSWVAHHVPNAFFSAQQRVAAAAADVAAGASAEDDAAAAASPPQLLARLGLLTLLLHVRVLGARERLRRTRTAARTARTHPVDLSPEHARIGARDAPSSLESLLHALTASTSHAAAAAAAAAATAHPVAGGGDAWSLVTSSAATLQACAAPPPPLGCTAAWELAEELQELAATAATAAAEWLWLGSPEALWAVLDAPPHATQRHRCYLLPWTTLAQSHQPWRVYDESGQARRAAQEWETALHTWLSGAPSAASASAPPPRRPPVVRLVSVAEEVRFFSDLQAESGVHLGADVRVRRDDVRGEERELAPAVRRALQAASLLPPLLPAAAAEDVGWYAEADADGLD
ncbi:hypothetical protein NESM_000640000 [Novymonas esmeraldas]|uniref:Uncharacterized protein n=1 Tax=Novymonas esmeraldas TaxID=1808958 RepID=A0AAW0EU66_9TRYP